MDPRDEYEFYDEWLNRSEEEHDIGLEDYNDMRCIEEYVKKNILTRMTIQTILIMRRTEKYEKECNHRSKESVDSDVFWDCSWDRVASQTI